MRSMRAACLSILLLSGVSGAALATEPATSVLKGTTAETGLLPVHVDKDEGRILISLPAPDEDGVSGRYLYVTALATGLGSAPVGLDRAMSGGSELIVFRRVGKKMVAEIENPRFRATGGTDAEQAAARDSFAYSTIWMGDIAAETADGRLLVDVSSFLTRDAIGIAKALNDSLADELKDKQFKLVPELTVADPHSVKVFPENIEMEARQTFVSVDPGREIGNIAPTTGNISFIVRHSLVKLPEPGYQPLPFDPRTGSFATQILDYSAPLGQPIVKELVNRFRLEKVDPAAPRSRVKEPIVFYIDRSAPEPIRTALLEGASWWKQAFEDAGFIDAYRVEILPEGIDPLDTRYNVVNWVNRATRGWSYGQAIEDPRTGEIIKGNVLLGSLRVRQDMLIFEGLLGADKVGTGGPDDPTTAALARIRQLAAHEVGHALGLSHNFAASTQGRYSVMDYPAPRVTLADGELSLADAYGAGLGRWDSFAIDWLYGSDGKAEADAKAAAAVAEGLRFVADDHARPLDAAQPTGSLWDDSADPAAELERMIAVRRAAVDNFGLGALAAGEPVANLKRKFVPIWLLHRYQVEAAAKLVGGVDFSYSLRGDGLETSRPVPAEAQRRALDALLATLSPEALTVPEGLVPLLSSGWSGNNDRQFDIEILDTAGGPVFDSMVAAETAAAVTLDTLLQPERVNRLAQQHRLDAGMLGPDELIDRLLAAVLPSDSRDARAEAVQRRVATTTALELARLQRHSDLSPTLALQLDDKLQRMAARLARAKGDDDTGEWSRGLARLLSDREALEKMLADTKREPKIPPGMPIGGTGGDWMGE